MNRLAWGAGLAGLVALTLGPLACGDVVARPIGAAASDAGGDGATADGVSGGEGSVSDGPTADIDGGFCSGQGPIPLPGTDLCTGDLAHLFRFAACACNSLAVSGILVTDSFDSTADGGTGGSAASIAANGEVATNAQTTVGGSVWAGGQGLPVGTPAVSLSSPAGVTSTVALDIESGGDVDVGGALLVGRDVYADGDVTLDGGTLSVVGGVHVPAGDSATGVTTGGGVTHGPVQITPPCDCSAPIDIPALVSAHQTSSDDGAIGLATTGLDDPPSAVTLPCGQYYVDGIHGGSVTIDVTGRVALFVGGDMSVTQGLTVTLAPGAELDLFVAGNVDLETSVSLGDSNAPARVRLYVGGATFTLSANAPEVGANIYAPNADVQFSSNFTMWGAIFAQSLQFSGSFTLHYDTSVLTTPGCTPPGSSCTTCDDCSGSTPACKGGTCTVCTSTADCCAPLECDTGTGRCQPPLG